MTEVRMKDGLPVVEAEADLYVYVTEEDISCGVRKDPCRCAIAQAVKRSVGHVGGEAEIHRGIAYVKAPDEEGEMVWRRFRLGPRTRQRVEMFDKTGIADPAGYLLKAPTKTQRLDYRRAQAKKAVKRPGSRGRIRTRERINIDEMVRSGSGVVHHNFA